MSACIPVDHQAIADFCRKWRVTELGLCTGRSCERIFVLTVTSMSL